MRDDAQEQRVASRGRGETVEGDVRVDGTRGAIGEQGVSEETRGVHGCVVYGLL